MKKHVFILAALIASACTPTGGVNQAPSARVVAQIPVDSSFHAESFSWTSGFKSYDLRERLIARDGRLLMCGVGAHRSGQYHAGNLAIQRARHLSVNGVKVLEDFTFYNSVNSINDLDTATSNCADAGPVPARNADIQFGSESVSIRP